MIKVPERGKFPTPSSVEAVCDECGLIVVERCKLVRKGGDWNADEGQVINRLVGQNWTFVRKVLRCPGCEAKRRVKAKAPALTVVPQMAAAMRQPIPQRAAIAIIADAVRVTSLVVAAARAIPPEPRPEPGKEPVMPELVTATAALLPQPTREQRRLIMEALSVAYDVKENRYFSNDTDVTVAKMLGGGIRAGWVAEVRDEFFGSDGGNSEMAELRAEIDKMKRAIADMVKEGQSLIDLANQTSVKVADLGKQHSKLMERYQAVCAAVGPKAGAK